MYDVATILPEDLDVAVEEKRQEMLDNYGRVDERRLDIERRRLEGYARANQRRKEVTGG